MSILSFRYFIAEAMAELLATAEWCSGRISVQVENRRVDEAAYSPRKVGRTAPS